MRKVAIVGGKRIPFARSFSNYMGVPGQELMTTALKATVDAYGLKGEAIGEVVLGAVIKHASDWNFARECALGSGLSANTPAYDLVQACGTSLQAAIAVANKIRLGQIECGIAGGADTNSDLPVTFSRKFAHIMLAASRERTFGGRMKQFMKIRPADLKPQTPGVVEPRTGMSMGQSCEKMVKDWKVTREEQDDLAFQSQQRAVAAYQAGFYNDLLVPCHGLNADNNVRADSTREKMAKLKPAFDTSGAGTLTAGNSSALSDGAACVLLASEEYAKKKGWPILAYLPFTETAAVDFVQAEGLLMAPAYAVPRMLQRANLKLQDFDYYEIHEAFAGQVLCTLKAWESDEFCRQRLGLSGALGSIDRAKLNVKGGSVALGHPFAATGARIVASLAKILNEKGAGRGLISICTGGGMGVTAILEK
ncbi:MAG TPA: acetyl-CoA C-acetyltransferase [Bdellovibrionales bacterium]|nr:acetyl-CoA C-acetyltransferase [Bdellovibrionales bacterium]